MQELKTKDIFLDTVILNFSVTPTSVDIFRQIDKMKTFQIKDNRIENSHTLGKNFNIKSSIKIDKNRIILTKHKDQINDSSSYQNDYQLTYLLENNNETIHKGYTTINKQAVGSKTIETKEESTSYCYIENCKFVESTKEKKQTTTENGKISKTNEAYAEIALPTRERLNIACKNGEYTYLLKKMDEYGKVSSTPISKKLTDTLLELKDDAYAIINNEEYYNLTYNNRNK